MKNKDQRIDDYIQNSAEFAQPILAHLRKIIHANCPETEETIKWGFPHFEYAGSILCSVASFKQHCIFGFFRASEMEDKLGVLETVGKTGMGHLGKITSIKDLPNDKVLSQYIQQAMKLNEQGKRKVAKPSKTTSSDILVPTDLTEALALNEAAKNTFEKFSPTNKKEYIEWITEAKTEKTRQSRLATAIEWMAEGKIRHWKYVK